MSQKHSSGGAFHITSGIVCIVTFLRNLPLYLKIVFTIFLTGLVVFWYSLPDPLFTSPVSTVLYDRNGELLGATVADDQQWRFPEIDSVPEKFTRAIVAFEDKRFFLHPGCDPFALVRALLLNIRKGGIHSGGSTLTMQTIRLSRNNPPRTVPQKFIEIILALRLELTTTKRTVLKLYASHAPFGGNVVGLEAASWRYFGCSSSMLSWAESALLAVLPNSPSLMHPGRNREQLRTKRDRLLRKLDKTGIIDSTTCALALLEKLPPRPRPIPRKAPHLLTRAGKDVRKNENNIPSALRIHSTLDAALQKRVAEIISRHHYRLAGNHVYNAAALVADNHTGTVLAYVGNSNNTEVDAHGYAVDIITAPRSTGSVLKPFLYGAMVETGDLLPTQLVYDLPMRIGGFAPQNFNRGFEGVVPAHAALSRSLNVPAVGMLYQYGIDRFYALVTQLGMTTLFRKAEDYGLTLIIGGAEGTLWDITGMYSAMARNLGRWFRDSSSYVPPFQPLSYRLTSGSESTLNFSNREFPYSAGATWLTFEAMTEVVRPEEESTWEQFTSAKRVAWKTGTSFGYRDAWAVGVTPSYTVGVWVGNADGVGRPNLTGLSAAAPILFAIYDLFDEQEWFSCPEADLALVTVCAKSGFRAGRYCSETKEINAPQTARQSRTCPYCKPCHLDSTGSYRVHSDCENVADMIHTSWFVLPPAAEWFYRRKHYEYKPLPPWRDDCSANAPEGKHPSMSIIYPRYGSSMYIPVELNGEKGKTVFKAAHRNSDATIHWHLDNEYLGSTNTIHQMSAAPAPGKHLLTLVDDAGETVSRRFEIITKE